MGGRASTPQAQSQPASRPRSDTFPHGPSSSGSHQNTGASAELFPTSSSSRNHPLSGSRSSTSRHESSSSAARRARSMSAVSPTELSGALLNSRYTGVSMSDSDADSSPEAEDNFAFFRIPGSLPLRLFQLAGIKCPVCGKQIASDNVELHLVECLTKPRLEYNEDVLTEPKGECVICFDEMECGQSIARLPCLCIYHKRCIDSWFRVNRSCPEHPGD
ncbi:E3 ubiquitin-protein ligase znrf2-like [Paramacrobiotus metropolitanus]|uniref:E3 ubiquitin-protein ligase znrf2-like n=1 Tax=Paramacrobiotus metropolitanus TaxID=2943436 RepID=UPI002445CF08|nr:E3 ubiquitin-protein ligase znrf2-like [Paramacrobiotus metropolitanus]